MLRNVYIEYLQDWQKRQGFCQMIDEKDLKPKYSRSLFPSKKKKINPLTGFPYHLGDSINYNVDTPTNGPILCSRIPRQITPKRNIINNDEPAYYVEGIISISIVLKLF